MNTIKESVALAKNIVSNGYKYLYGGKDQNYTSDLVQRLAKQYPNVFTASLLKEALKDADKGYKAIDCSGFVCKVLGIKNIGSAQLKATAVKILPVTKENAKEGMILWKNGHVAFVGDELKIYEAKSTASDLTVSSWDKRAKSFTKLLVVKGSALAENPQTEEKEKPFVASPTIRKGVKGIHVKYLQQDLNYILGDGTLVADGSCGGLTEAAIKVFQEKVGFKGKDIDGIYGPKSYAKMKKLLE